RRSAVSVKWAPYEQHPCTSSGDGPVSTPWQPRPKMQPQWLSMKVTSKTQVRFSSGSSNEIHSWAWSRLCPFLCSATRQLSPQLARRQQAVPELVHHHPFVGSVEAVTGKAHAEEEYGRVKHPAQR